MNRCVIVSAGPFRDPAKLAGFLQTEDHFIAADGGWKLAELLGVRPSVLVADFDSAVCPNVPEEVEVVTLPEEKDETDTGYALKLGYEAGYREFLLLGCTGGRLDHWQAVLADAASYVRRGCNVVIADEQNEIHLLTPGAYAFPVRDEEKVSVFAFADEVKGLFADGLYYEINDLTISPYDSLCVSNRCVDADFQIVFKSGLLLLYFSKD